MLRWVSHTITGSKLSQKESEIRPPKICQNSNFSAPAVMVVNSGVIIFLCEKNIIHGTLTNSIKQILRSPGVPEPLILHGHL